MGCLKCGFQSQPHRIQYSKHRGMFPLCEKCWSGESISGRKRYVSKLLFMWFRDGYSIRDLIKIEKRVYGIIEKEAKERELLKLE